MRTVVSRYRFTAMDSNMGTVPKMKIAAPAYSVGGPMGDQPNRTASRPATMARRHHHRVNAAESLVEGFGVGVLGAARGDQLRIGDPDDHKSGRHATEIQRETNPVAEPVHAAGRAEQHRTPTRRTQHYGHALQCRLIACRHGSHWTYGSRIPSAFKYPSLTLHFSSLIFSSKSASAARECSIGGRFFIFSSAAPMPPGNAAYATISSQCMGRAKLTGDEVASIFLYGQNAQPTSFFSSMVRNCAIQASWFSPDSPIQMGAW